MGVSQLKCCGRSTLTSLNKMSHKHHRVHRVRQKLFCISEESLQITSKENASCNSLPDALSRMSVDLEYDCDNSPMLHERKTYRTISSTKLSCSLDSTSRKVESEVVERPCACSEKCLLF
mmetsp:Transcript_31117/g.54081  ORF Transcript_31117/g.54081 Transcript_31117/m.54081 type:complete len:120 (+) Transcript_31117:5925-6284(+)